jgi:hypothetical protein
MNVKKQSKKTVSFVDSMKEAATCAKMNCRMEDLIDSETRKQLQSEAMSTMMKYKESFQLASAYTSMRNANADQKALVDAVISLLNNKSFRKDFSALMNKSTEMVAKPAGDPKLIKQHLE